MRTLSFVFMLILASVLSAAPVRAQCTSSGSGATIASCPDALNPQRTDYLLFYQNAPSSHTRRLMPATLFTLLSAADITTALGGQPLFANNNLSDVSSKSTARVNLGLGTIATQDASNVSITGGTISGVTQTITSGTISGVTVTATGYRTSGTITQSGGLVNTNSRYFASDAQTGSNSASRAANNYWSSTDTVNFYGANNLNQAWFNLNMGGGSFAGNRNVVFAQGFMNTAANPGDASLRNYVAIGGRSTAAVTNGGLADNNAIDGTGLNGSLFGGSLQASLTNGSYWSGITGLELGVSSFASTSVGMRTGMNIVLNPGDAVRGKYTDVAIQFGRNTSTTDTLGWEHFISIGRRTADHPSAADSTLFLVQPREYGGSSGGTIPFNIGIDLRKSSITSGGFAFISPGFDVSPIGAVSASGITTTGTMQAQTATLGSVTVANGGEYYLDAGQLPTFLVQPPASGTTATIATNRLGPQEVRRFGATGSGFVIGDVLTVSGGAGTASTLQVSAVTATGGIKAWTLAGAGSMTSAPANPVTLTGGSGTGALVYIVWSQSSNTFVPSIIWAASTGANYAVNDKITMSGDTMDGGTNSIFNVTSVTATGGITAMTVDGTSNGSISAVGGTLEADGRYYHVGTGGSGTGGYYGVTYKVNSINVNNAGSGYVNGFSPYILPNRQADYLNASLTPVMTGANATLALNPSGGTVQAGGFNVGRFVTVPGSSTASCTTGDFSADASFIYTCRGTNLWTRAANVGGW